MAEATRVGIIGGGWPGSAHARGYTEAGGFKIVAVADLIPERRQKLMAEFGIAREYSDAAEMIAQKDIDAVSICLPNHLHGAMACAALRAGKHVMCEKPPAANAKEARQMQRAAEKNAKVLMFSLQRRFSPHAQAAKQAIQKGFAGEVYHARATWTRTRGVPRGTGWFTQKDKSGGGALVDIGIHMLDLAWFLLGCPKPQSAYGLTHRKFGPAIDPQQPFDVEDAAFAMVRFEGGKSLELAASWALNQPEHQNGALCRLYGDQGTIEVYTEQGAVLYRDFAADGTYKENPLKPPKTVNHAALMRSFRDCIINRTPPHPGPEEGVALMEMVEAIYQSAESGRSVGL